MNRRKFLGAAAALSGLSLAGQADGEGKGSSHGTNSSVNGHAYDGGPGDVDVSHGDYGSSRASVEPGAPVWAALELPETVDEETHLSVNGHAYDGEPGDVEIHAGVGDALLTFNCSPERAMAFAEELTLAAEHAWEMRDHQ